MTRKHKPVLSFTATVQQVLEQFAVPLPRNVRTQWGPLPNGACPVEGTIQGWDFRSMTVAESRRLWLLLPSATLKHLAAQPGDEVRITVALAD